MTASLEAWTDFIREMTPDERRALSAAAIPRMVPDYVPHTPHPSQLAFLLQNCREAFFGGAGGGGKSDALLVASTQYVDVPGYSALILRRSFADLNQPGAIMDRAAAWWTATNAWKPGGANGRTWYFPTSGTPARITFGYVGNRADIEQYRGAEYQCVCVAVGTLVQMADGTTRPIQDIKAGDLVRTLQGPAPVTASRATGVKPVVEVTTPFGTSTISAAHRFLTTAGWASPQELTPTRSRPDDTRTATSPRRSRAARTLPGSRPPDRPRVVGSRRATPRRVAVLAGSAYSATPGTGAATSCGRPRAPLPLPAWSARAVLLPPDPPSGMPRIAHGSPPRVPGRDRAQTLRVSGSPSRCSIGSGPGGGRPPRRSTADRARTPRPVGAGASDRSWAPAGDRPNIPARTRTVQRWRYSHPYNSTSVVAREAVHLASVSMAPAGAAATWDLTVQGPNHYVLACSIVVQNCWDELTQFDEDSYRFLFSRLRGPSLICQRCSYPVTLIGEATAWTHDEGYDPDRFPCAGATPDRSVLDAAPDGTTLADVPLRMRSASNPGGRGHAWVRARLVDPDTAVPGSVFIPSRIEDNPSINRAAYRDALSNLTTLERMRLESGDWDAADEGAVFKRDWLPAVPMPTPIQLRGHDLSRGWDLAATAPAPHKDPDWSAGVLIAIDRRTGQWTVLDARRIQGTPGQVERFVVETAKEDMASYGYIATRMEQEGGSGGANTIHQYTRLLAGFDFSGERPQGSKSERARPVAVAAENGYVQLAQGAWNREYLDELTAFPMGAHDDLVDATSLAFAAAAQYRRVRVIL